MRTMSYLAMIAIVTAMLAGCASTQGTSPKGLEVPIEKAALQLSADVKSGGYRIVTAKRSMGQRIIGLPGATS